jgi:hypothetical protein
MRLLSMRNVSTVPCSINITFAMINSSTQIFESVLLIYDNPILLNTGIQ